MAKTIGNHWVNGGVPARVGEKIEINMPGKLLAKELRMQGKIKTSEIELITQAYIDLRKMLAQTNPNWTETKLNLETSQQLKKIIKSPKH
jgi:hypothetical protein